MVHRQRDYKHVCHLVRAAWVDRDGVVSEDQLIVSQKPEDVRGTAPRPRAVREWVSAPPLAAALCSVLPYGCMARIAFPCVSLSPKNWSEYHWCCVKAHSSSLSLNHPCKGCSLKDHTLRSIPHQLRWGTLTLSLGKARLCVLGATVELRRGFLRFIFIEHVKLGLMEATWK